MCRPSDLPSILLRIGILAVAIFLVGCSGSGGFNGELQLDDTGKEVRFVIVTNEEFRTGGLALAGFVVRDSVKIHRTPDLPSEDAPFDHSNQNGFWGPVFERIYQSKISQPVLVPFWNFDNYVPDDLMEHVWATFAREGTLSPEILEQIRATGTEVRFVAMVLAYHDDLTYHVIVPGLKSVYRSGVKAGAAGLSSETPGDGNSTPGITRQRNTRFYMAIFDLKSTRLVWHRFVGVELHEDADRVALDNIGGFAPRALGDGEYAIEEVEDLTGAPSFSKALELGLKKLISEMEKAVGGLPDPPPDKWELDSHGL